MKRFLALILAAFMLVSLASCGEETETSQTEETTTEATTAELETEKASLTVEVGKVKDSSPALDNLKNNGYNINNLSASVNYAEDEEFGFQLEKPEKGETIAVLHTSEGDITLRLFEKYAPNTVNNFIKLAKAGRYDGVLFHRVINDFMIQTGDYENNDGTGGTSVYGEAFADEFCDKLLNIRGSVAMANAGKDTNGSQFFINQVHADTYNTNGVFKTYENNWKSIKSSISDKKDAEKVGELANYGTSSLNTDAVPKAMKKLYEKHGGNIWLDGAYNASDAGHTVFAQVIEGMDVVDDIAGAAVSSDGSNKPVTDITIDSIEITKYKK